MNPYEILDVPKDATDSEIKRNYREKAKSLHPDLGGDPERFKQLALSYDILSNSEKRRHYDKTGETETKKSGRAYEMAIQAFFAAVESGAADIEVAAITGINSGIRRCDEELRKMNMRIANLKKYLKRILKAPAEDFLTFYANTQINEIEAQIAEQKDIRADMEKAIKLIHEYVFEKAQERTSAGHFSNMFVTIDTTGSTRAGL